MNEDKNEREDEEGEEKIMKRLHMQIFMIIASLLSLINDIFVH